MSVALRLALQERRSAELADRVRRLLGPFSGREAALDAGCGTGSLAFALAPHVSEVVGVDTREDYLEAARASAPANVRFQAGDVMSLPFGYAEFDLVCCHRVLHHVRRPELAFGVTSQTPGVSAWCSASHADHSSTVAGSNLSASSCTPTAAS